MQETLYMTITLSYKTFGGEGWCKYRCPICVGKIPYSEMECIVLDCLPPHWSFEITEVSEDSVSFVVTGPYLESNVNEVHTIPLKGGEAVFVRTERKVAVIEDTEFPYEHVDRMTVSTEE